MTFMQIVFLITALVTFISAVMVVSARRMMHAALWLVLTLTGVAVLYAMLEASFYVVVQVLVYIGAIAILVIFAVMLTQRSKEAGAKYTQGWWVSLVFSAGLFFLLVAALSAWQGFSTPLPAMPVKGHDLAVFGKALVDPQQYLIPFEVASVLLLAALIGSVYIAFERKGGRK